MASNVSAMTDGLATERWINEGGHLAPELDCHRRPASYGSIAKTIFGAAVHPYRAYRRGWQRERSAPVG